MEPREVASLAALAVAVVLAAVAAVVAVSTLAGPALGVAAALAVVAAGVFYLHRGLAVDVAAEVVPVDESGVELPHPYQPAGDVADEPDYSPEVLASVRRSLNVNGSGRVEAVG
jgi:hypothetical protein